MNSGNVKVSVIIITYNHEKYIAQAIESVLSQEGVPFEIIIGDDASSDRTSEIVMSYAERYPETIHAIVREKNIGAIPNAFDCLKQARGQYIAACEGDDFWCDVNKLRKQTEFLDSHADYSAVASDIFIVDENGVPRADVKTPRWISRKRDYTLRDCRGIFLPGHPCSLMRRNYFPDKSFDGELFLRADPDIGDRTTAVQWACRGRIYRMKEKLCCYRVPRITNGNNLTSRLFGEKIDYERELAYTSVLEHYAESQTNSRVSFDYHRAELLFSALKSKNKSAAGSALRQMKSRFMLPIYFAEIAVRRIAEKI